MATKRSVKSAAKRVKSAAKLEIRIRIWTDPPRELPDSLYEAFAPHAEHVAHMLRQGCISGEIVDEHFSGWWEIQVGAGQ